MYRSKHGQAIAGLAGNRSFLVAHALLRAASRLISTPKRRHECRRGTRGRVRYVNTLLSLRLLDKPVNPYRVDGGLPVPVALEVDLLAVGRE